MSILQAPEGLKAPAQGVTWALRALRTLRALRSRKLTSSRSTMGLNSSCQHAVHPRSRTIKAARKIGFGPVRDMLAMMMTMMTTMMMINWLLISVMRQWPGLLILHAIIAVSVAKLFTTAAGIAILVACLVLQVVLQYF